jgi:hypothetical protein
MLKQSTKTLTCKGSFWEPSPTKHLGVIGSYPAVGLAFGFFLVTCFVLFKDVADGAPITTDHVMSFAVLVGTFAGGHLLAGQLQQRRLVPALGLLVLFASGTFYCVTASGGRNAATTGAKAELVHKSNEDRARLEGEVKEAAERLNLAQEAEDAECGTGDGKACKGRRKTRMERETYLHVLEARLRLEKPQAQENPELHQAAKVFASLPGVRVSEEAIFSRLVLWFPFLKALFCEVATLVFGSVGIRHRKPLAVSGDRETVLGKPLETLDLGKPSKPAVRLGFLNGYPWKPFSKTEALADLLAFVDGNGFVPSQVQLKERFGVGSKGTVSKWLSEWEARGLISRSQVGRCKVVSK